DQGTGVRRPGTEFVEPQAGTWKTWVLKSGSQLRLPPPPDEAATQVGLGELRALAAQRDAEARAQITFWDAGWPGYRWTQLAKAQVVKHGIGGALRSRPMALLSVAIYDATIAAWDTKYTYQRPRPSQVDRALETALPDPANPSYPCEHAVVAGAASTMLGYL